jgi:glycosyltransferase involved in cell wall biosynthesis
MKICLINNLYKPYCRGGAERIAELTIEEFLKQGHEVFIISTKPSAKFSVLNLFKFSAEISINSLIRNYQIFSLYFNLDKISRGIRFFWHILDLFDFRSFFIIKKILKKEKADLVITHNLKGVGYLTPLAIKFLSIKHIHTLHDIQLLHPSGLILYGREKIIETLPAFFYSLLCRFLFNSPAVIISPSKWLLGEHFKKGFFKNSKRVILPNPAVKNNNSEFFSARRAKRKNIFSFLYVGQIEEHKGILFLAEAFQEAALKNCELIIAGDGSKILKLKNLTGNFGNIKILGKKGRQEIEKLMQDSNCLIVPSLCYENSPAVICEAAAAGLPVIASDIGGIPEIINNPKLLFKPGSKNDLIACLNFALKKEQASLFLKNKTTRTDAEWYIKELLKQ